VQQPRNRT